MIDFIVYDHSHPWLQQALLYAKHKSSLSLNKFTQNTSLCGLNYNPGWLQGKRRQA